MEAIAHRQDQLGTTLLEEGVSFSIYVENIDLIELRIYQGPQDKNPFQKSILNRKEHAINNIFSIDIKQAREGMAYEWYVKKDKWIGPLIDPYACEVVEMGGEKNKHRNVIISQENAKDTRPYIPWEETVIYELHVGNFTSHSSSNVTNKGTFDGVIEKLPYLKELGITTIELLPVMIWNESSIINTDPETGEKLKDVWGYNPINFFSVMPKYVEQNNRQKGIESFKGLVKKAHELGMEIILDVVYNHTGEGGEGGNIFNLKALGDETYYRKIRNYYLNHSGTGNTLDTHSDIVKKLVIDSLKYWINIIGVDGFRFDLASILTQNREGWWVEDSLMHDIAKDPEISKVKLITESWDAKGSYDVGRMPYPILEWSDYFRDTVRKVIRGDNGGIMNLVRCMVGQEVFYQDSRFYGHEVIHFVTAHDGFTLWDLVSYNTKHNERNGEQGRDGASHNWSYNCGYEGETTKESIIELRKKKVKNCIALLVLSKGVPMLVMGDEVGRTQKGNNNAYCQDNEISWFDWGCVEKNKDILDITQKIISLRKHTKAFSEKLGYTISWHGVHLNRPDWGYYSRTVAMLAQNKQEKYYMIINNYSDDLYFELPNKEGYWEIIIDTSSKNEGKLVKQTHQVNAFTICVLKQITKK